MPHAFATFGAAERPIAGSYTNSWGTSPGQARMQVGVGFGNIGQIGDLKFQFRTQSFTLRDALVVDPTISLGVTDTPRADFVALDRRWKWQFRGRIAGDWNFEKKDGSLLRPKSPREMAALLLDALGETNYDVSVMPNDPRPRTVWDHVRPVEELNRLCADFGCAVCFDHIANKALIVKIGVGGSAPAPGDHIAYSQSLIWPEPPDGVRIIGGELLFQTALALGEAVGREVDGSYKAIDQLSYKPPGGWSSIEPFEFTNLDTEFTDPATNETLYHRDLAQASVWRCYRISGQKAGGFSPAALKNTPQEPTALTDLGPFTGSLLDKDPTTNERLPCYARGTFADERMGFANSKPHTRFKGSISIDSEQRIVTFSAPLFRYDENNRPAAADMVLIAAYQCSKDGVPIRYELARATSFNNAAGEQIEHHDEIVREIVEQSASSTGAARDNGFKVAQEANYYLDALVARYQTATATRATYGGFIIDQSAKLSGTLRSVTYSFSIADTPKTSFAWNCERSKYITPWEKRNEARAQRQADYVVRKAAADAKVRAAREAFRKAAQ